MREFILERLGCPIHYWLDGPVDRPLVVLTHGAGIDHREFDPQIQALSGRYRLLAWDVRGHGLSRPMGTPFTAGLAVDDLLAMLDMLGVRQTMLFGHSMGGNIHQEFVFLHPERVKALVMLGCTCNTCRLSTFETIELRVGLELLGLYPWNLLVSQMAQVSSIKPEVRAYLSQALHQLDKSTFLAIFRALAQVLHYEPGYRIAQPMLLTHGDKDVTGNIKRTAPEWAAREPHCRYIVVPGAGHMANMDNPAFFNRILLDFLSEQQS